MYPPAFGVVKEACKEGIQFGEYFIPGGSLLFVSAKSYSLIFNLLGGSLQFTCSSHVKCVVIICTNSRYYTFVSSDIQYLMSLLLCLQCTWGMN